MDTRDDHRNRLPGLLLASVVLSVIPACASTAGPAAGGGQVVAGSPPDRIVYRPAYPIQGTRPLYLKGYAGLSYGPDRQAAPLEPTGYYERPGRPFGWWLHPQNWHQ